MARNIAQTQYFVPYLHFSQSKIWKLAKNSVSLRHEIKLTMKGRNKLPIGIQEFEKLRREGYLYIDKTEQIYQMVSRGSYYFLSRPRRFGKSLLVSAIHALFDGNRELFDGTVGQRLAIADKEDIDWETYPVLHLDLNTQKYDAPEKLSYVLNLFLTEKEALYGIRSDGSDNYGPRFESVIEAAFRKTGHRAVILVDEYDKPMLQAIGKPELQEAFRSTLKGFYGALKSKDGCIKFALLTGVTKFGKVSVFSDLNNLDDISMDAEYWDVCGINQEELLTSFPSEIEALARANDMTREECVEKLRLRYDGYHFHQSAKGVYNPFSVLNTFNKKEFGSYWFETGTPSYLVTLLQLHNYRLEKMATCVTNAKVLNSIDANSTNPIPAIYQSGYLTIKGYDKEFKTYSLGFPNEEVEEGFLEYLLPWYTSIDETESAFCIQQFVQDVREGNVDQFVKRLKSLFADTPYELIKDLENHYQNVLWILYKLMGYYVRPEYHTSEGRIDLAFQSARFCYVMEFKLDGTAEEAMEQIKDRSYTLPFEMNGQQIIRIGMNFSSKTRNIERYIVAREG